MSYVIQVGRARGDGGTEICLRRLSNSIEFSFKWQFLGVHLWRRGAVSSLDYGENPSITEPNTELMTNFLEIPDFEKGTLQKREMSTDPSVPI